jgi:hypothetical protein
VRPRRQGLALLCGPSTSPLDVMHTSVTLSIRCTLALGTIAAFTPGVAQEPATIQAQSEISMFLENFGGPFVTSDFAKKLGVLVMEQKYPGTSFDAASAAVVDKGDTWWVTFTVTQWPQEMQKLRPLLPHQLTLLIRKSDAAVLGIR